MSADRDASRAAAAAFAAAHRLARLYGEAGAGKSPSDDAAQHAAQPETEKAPQRPAQRRYGASRFRPEERIA